MLSSLGLLLYVEVLKGNEKHVMLMDTSDFSFLRPLGDLELEKQEELAVYQ